MGPLRILAGAAIAALVAGTLSTVAPAAASPPATEAAARDNYAVPKVGSCHLYAFRQANAFTSPSGQVPCDSKHTAVTVAVKRLTGRVDWEEPGLITKKSSTPCIKAIINRLGGDELTWMRTTYRPTWYFPTKKQRARGAKWIRCDLVQYSGGRILPLPEDLNLGRGPVPDRFARCLHAKVYFVACSKPHAWRATGFLRLSGARPPSEKEARRIALRRCPATLTSRRFRFEINFPYEWRAGVKTLVCYSETTR
jgi:hypothetical protein